MITEYPPRNAPELWQYLLKRERRIVGLQAVQYDTAPHYIPSHNIPIQSDARVKHSLLRGRIPECDQRYGSRNHRPNYVVAVASPVFINSHRWPYAMNLVDWDCANTNENVVRLAGGMSVRSDRDRWWLGTERGLHTIEAQPFPVQYYPIQLGLFILDFAPLDEHNKKLIELLGNYLIRFWDNPNKIRRWTSFVLGKFKHLDDPSSGGLRSDFDFRHGAHNLAEWLKFMETKKGAFDALRISEKSPGGRSPIVVARRWGDCKTEFFV